MMQQQQEGNVVQDEVQQEQQKQVQNMLQPHQQNQQSHQILDQAQHQQHVQPNQPEQGHDVHHLQPNRLTFASPITPINDVQDSHESPLHQKQIEQPRSHLSTLFRHLLDANLSTMLLYFDKEPRELSIHFGPKQFSKPCGDEYTLWFKHEACYPGRLGSAFKAWCNLFTESLPLGARNFISSTVVESGRNTGPWIPFRHVATKISPQGEISQCLLRYEGTYL